MSAKSSGLKSASANIFRQLTDSGGGGAAVLGSSVGRGGCWRCGTGEGGLERSGDAGREPKEELDDLLEVREEARDGPGLGIGVTTRGFGGDFGGDARG